MTKLENQIFSFIVFQKKLYSSKRHCGRASRTMAHTTPMSMYMSPSIPRQNRYVPCGGGYEVSHGVVELPGPRKYASPCMALSMPLRLTEWGGSTMEDKTTSEVLHDKAFFGVYDGHGGRQAAELCQENLHKHLMREISKHWYTLPSLTGAE